ncbi:monocarboxylate transporter 13-like [Pecten maximus]|uniref:monocarboxylate transporter 13-like n=1 Tax=Pecten maximus TaxID=6579 RepID=UPI001459113E|nr:monocarboxylate transporter 13-like [Pecten maximus]
MLEEILIETMRKPDGGWGWMVAFSSLILGVLINGICLTYGIFFPVFLKHFDESPVVSVLVNKYDSRKVVAFGTVITSGGFFLSSFSQSLNVLLIFYSIAGGIGIGIIYLPSIVIIGVYFDKRRALATGIAVSGGGVGAFVFAPITEHLLETYGWRGTMWIMSAIILNGVVISATFRPI